MDNEVFTIDKAPSPVAETDIPRYGITRKSIELVKLQEQSTPRTRPPQNNSNPCWNCGKVTHNVRQCNVDMNMITMEWNRELQLIKKEQGNTTHRYHESERAKKYAHINPGTISASLRKIMGLRENEMPPFIYRLRNHGYPKAWLRHASIKPSGINLYDAHGNEVADPDAEEGEILEEEDKIRYDLSKLIKFPGFNAPMPSDDVFDEYEKLNVPAYSEDQKLENMVDDLQEKAVSEYRLKKDRKKEREVVENSNEASFERQKSDSRDSLITEESSSITTQLSVRENSCDSSIKDTVSRLSVESEFISNLSQTDLNSEDLKTVLNTSSEDGMGRVLTCQEGTPILKLQSGHTRLPPAENFSKDICDVINFENLPESTGKFEKMRDLLKKVKRVLGFQKQNPVL